MYARLVSGMLSADKVQEAVDLWRESVAPSVAAQEGFKSARLVVERKTGKIISISLWETEADFQATVLWNQGQVAKFSHLFTVSPVVEGYAVVAEVIKNEK